jgi:ornithine carbamoyltransferase
LSTRPIAAVPASPAPAPALGQTWSEDLISINDLGPSGVNAILDLASLMKARPFDFRGALAGKQLVMFFEKPSLRTRLTFEAGITSLGGHAFFVDQTASRIDARESLSDIAHNLERWVDGIVLRTFAHKTVTEMAEHASIPVINALSELEHPCQALADYLTLQERFGNLQNVKLAYVGDGNNVAHSLMLAAACTGSTIRVATPEGYGPNPEILKQAKKIASNTGATIQVLHDAQKTVAGADAIYTDVWASMCHEQEADQRKHIFGGYQVTEKLFTHAAPGALFMHCLPAHRGGEVTAGVIDSPRSVVFDQAENRLHVQKAILLMLLGGSTQHFSAGHKKPRRVHA